jgi:hypothetical protein
MQVYAITITSTNPQKYNVLYSITNTGFLMVLYGSDVEAVVGMRLCIGLAELLIPSAT